MAKIGEIDKNLAVETTLTGVEDIVFRDVCEAPFELYGLWKPTPGKPFCRMDPAVAEQVNSGVERLNWQTAGGRVRFATDSSYVAIKAVWPGLNQMPHMPLCGQAGFDIYIDGEQHSRYRDTFIPTVESKKGYEAVIRLPGRKLRYFTVNFPLYNQVDALYVGLQRDAELTGGRKYKPLKPILYYGSSITQGGCASRPGKHHALQL